MWTTKERVQINILRKNDLQHQYRFCINILLAVIHNTAIASYHNFWWLDFYPWPKVPLVDALVVLDLMAMIG